MNCDKKDLLLYAVTDRAWLNGETLCSQVEKAIKGGATFIQLREKNLDQKHFLEEALEIQKLCKKYNVPFVINDNVEIAKKAIPNCNITYIDKTEMKQALSGYLDVLFHQDSQSIGGGLPESDFYYDAE